MQYTPETKTLAANLIKGVLLGDAFGAGWEMKSQLVDRDPGYNQDYTEMTIGTYFTLLRTSSPRALISFVTGTRFISSSRSSTVIRPSVIQYCENPTPETVDRMCKKQAVNPMASGNDPVEAAIVSALATHPSAYSALSTLLLVWAGHHFICTIKQATMIETLIAKLLGRKNRIRALLKQDPYLDKSTIDTAFDDIVREMEAVDAMPRPMDPLGADINHRALVGSDFGPETGLNGGSFRTFICALYCLRWADYITLWQNLRRVILFGGDVDTLAACVMPFVYAKIKGSEKNDLPKWVIDSLNWKNLTLLQ